MIKITRKTSYLLLIIILLWCITPLPSPYASDLGRGYDLRKLKTVSVSRVIDGDTIELTGGERVRYLGIDTPEKGELLFQEARQINIRTMENKQISMVVCEEEPRDKYGRILAWVYANGKMVNLSLLRSGLARILAIPPCSFKKIRELRKAAVEAVVKHRGLWRNLKTIKPENAGSYRGKYVTVEGKVKKISRSKKRIIMRLAGRSFNYFSVVIFSNSYDSFYSADINIASLLDRNVRITGKIRRYKGQPEIILSIASQIRITD